MKCTSLYAKARALPAFDSLFRPEDVATTFDFLEVLTTRETRWLYSLACATKVPDARLGAANTEDED
jgi:hypothetical protein